MSDYVDRIKPDSYGITTYLENLRRGQYQIPTFQREVVWDRDRVKRLWDSIYKFYPLGSILVWRTSTRLQNHREIGGYPLHDNHTGAEFQYLLDGQQRTTALLTSIYSGKIKGQDERDPSLYVDLTISEGDEGEDESWRNRFVYWSDIDDRDGTLLRNVGRKKKYDDGLIVRLEHIAHQYGALEERLESGGHKFTAPARSQLRRFRQVFDNYKLSFIELRGIEVVEVCQIFERINQAGQPLSMFDIVVAKTFRPESDSQEGFYLRGLFRDFRADLEKKGSQYSALDDMTLLQILAVLVREAIPSAGVHNITDRYLNVIRTEHLEEVWPDARKAIEKMFDFLYNHLRLPGPSLVPYRYFYLTIASYLFRNRTPDYDLLKRYFWYFSFHNEDLLRNTTDLRDHLARLKGAREGGEIQFDTFVVDRERIRDSRYSTRGRLSRAILSLYAAQDPRDWQLPDRSVLTDVYFALTDHPNLHHIFPLAFCDRIGEQGRRADSLLNIAFLTQITNLKISDKSPLDYMKNYVGTDYATVEQTHLLPNKLAEWVKAEQLPENALDIFIESRLDNVLSRLREYMGDIPLKITDSRHSATDASNIGLDGTEE